MTTRILVLHKSPEILQMVNEVLAEEQYEVITRLFSPECLREVEQIKPDLIILDYPVTNDEDSPARLEMLKSQRITQEIPVIASADAAQCLQEAGSNLEEKKVISLRERFRVGDLLRAIRQALSLREGRLVARGTRPAES